MITFCIPTYHFDPAQLVSRLCDQVIALKSDIQVRVYDDGTPENVRQKSTLRRFAESGHPKLTYVELSQNIGRAAIRNLMAREADTEYLVMLDADGLPTSDFVQQYLNAVTNHRNSPQSDQPLVCVGGRHYNAKPPFDPSLYLHWRYGSERESPDAKQREQNGWLGFQSNNFLVSRSLLLAHPFEEEHTGYGHEDTVWGQQFMGKDVQLLHIDNPVEHLGLEPATVFLRKQEEAIQNLLLLQKSAPHLRTRLINFVERRPLIVRLISSLLEQRLKDYLLSSKDPSLYALDMLKIIWYKS